MFHGLKAWSCVTAELAMIRLCLAYQYAVQGEKYSPSQVGSMVLTKMKETAGRFTDAPLIPLCGALSRCRA